MDKFYLNETNYKSKKYKYDVKDTIKPNKDNVLKFQTQPINDSIVKYGNKDYTQQIQSQQKDTYTIKEKGDKFLNDWIMKQSEPLIVFISDIIPETKVLPQLEKFRPLIKTTPLMTIEEYRKQKKIGEEGTIYLKKLKEKYGNIVLKILWASINLK
jgi:hypothetical protein